MNTKCSQPTKSSSLIQQPRQHLDFYSDMNGTTQKSPVLVWSPNHSTPYHTSLDLWSIPDCDTMFLKCLDLTTAKTTKKDPTNWL